MVSIRNRLLLLLVMLFVLAWLTVVVVTYTVTHQEMETLLDAGLSQDARVLHALVRRGGVDGELTLGPDTLEMDFSRYQKVLAFLVWRHGHLLLHSNGAPALAPASASGYADHTVGEEAWRVFSLVDAAADMTVAVAEPRQVRDQLVYRITRDALYPLSLAIPLLVIGAWFAVGRGLRPLHRVAEQLARRSAANLEPVNLAAVPDEINVLVRDINTLLIHLEGAIERERRFTADAAHEIRTPLAAIKTHAQLALRQAGDGADRDALRHIVQGVDRLSRLAEQLLTLARLDRDALANEFEPVEMGAVAGEAVRELSDAAALKGVRLTRAIGVGLVHGNAVALRILVRNLLDNAVRYTPSGGEVTVEVRAGDTMRVVVTDTGPGIPADERQRVLERFHRGEARDSMGCGLGLSIVKRIVDLHGARLSMSDGPGGRGLQVQVAFSAA